MVICHMSLNGHYKFAKVWLYFIDNDGGGALTEEEVRLETGPQTHKTQALGFYMRITKQE